MRRHDVPGSIVLALALLAGSCGGDGDERSDIDVWRIDCDRGTMSLQITGRDLLLASMNISFSEADCTPASGASCSLDLHDSPQLPGTLAPDGGFTLEGPGTSVEGSLDMAMETGSGTLTVDHATGACSCTWSGPWTAVLSCTDMGSQCVSPSDCPDGETCRCGRCEPGS
jgi:hypothetical protein